jgi:Fic family protein
MSAQIETERADYYAQLERQQRGSVDITGWLAWFLDCLGRAIGSAEETLSAVLYKAEFWGIANREPVSDRQRLVLNRMLDPAFEGHMNTSKYAKLAKCSNDTALRDIGDLVDRGLLVKNPSGGRSTSYRLPTREHLARTRETRPY